MTGGSGCRVRERRSVRINIILTRPSERHNPGRRGGRGGGNRPAFTLIELMAVILVILTLAALAFPLMSYVQRRVAYQTARAQIAAMSAAVESFNSDSG